jgi:hypothetical protein
VGATGATGAVGATGATGAAGPTGDTGAGVAIGGTTNQFLVKNSATDYDTKWLATPLPVANGGTNFTTAYQGGVAYAESATRIVTNAPGTSGQILRSNGTSAPTWATADYSYSTTAPASPTIGQTYYDTDNGQLLVYYGATTGWRQPWNMPWGHVASALITTTTTSTGGATFVTGSNLNFSVQQNRRYKYTVFGHFYQASVNDTTKVAITNGTGTEFNQISLLPFSNSTTLAAGFTMTFFENATSSAAITRQLRVSRQTGTSGSVIFFADATRIGSFIVEDMGPVGNPPAS